VTPWYVQHALLLMMGTLMVAQGEVALITLLPVLA
jgi:hypothetical protein